MVTYKTLYHGTCRAFVALAEEKEGLFGPENYDICFTPDLTHAEMFAEGWNSERGYKALREYFKDIPREYAKGVVLEFNPKLLGPLEERLDAGGVVEFAREGPVQIGREVKYL